MLIYGGVMLFYLLHRASKSRLLTSAQPQGEAAIPEDADVAAEWAMVEKIFSNENFESNAVVARRLSKCYGALRAVEEFSIALKRSECFGLLGVNGAGKTSTFRMLTALTPMTYGEAYMRDVVLSKEPRKEVEAKWVRVPCLASLSELGAWLARLVAFEWRFISVA
ncbi:hypothetical protein HPB50_013915 [Hyalomma asiaticum]|uniref:Uncharacterized protein n=1 Tax=Hyalomma asiaticum TaxID=266040 RepID=A0ACB7S9U4_HYAAI|nr:hypothetical protein HPB50_013915 [Hyalomma asiaticum]